MKTVKTLIRIGLGLIIGLALLFGLGYLLTMGDYTVPATVAQDPTLPHITINGYAYHAETFGDPANPVVITLHGGPGGDYRSILSLQELADEYYVVFFDQRGGGLSPRVDPEELTIASAIADVDSFVDYFGQGEKVNLIGHSWGAMLASAYVGQHPEKVDHLVLAEPGFLTTEFAEEFSEATQLKFSAGILTYFLKSKFEALHVNGPDDHASADYFGHQFPLYPGSDHPQSGYRCPGSPPHDFAWRYGAVAANAIFEEALDSEGNFDINLVEGVENFENTALFMVGECQSFIGEEFQSRQMQLFPSAELVVIPDAGHEMFHENPLASAEAVREYLNISVVQ
jgi:proline iminopeptidase